jgi:hypothetical protein
MSYWPGIKIEGVKSPKAILEELAQQWKRESGGAIEVAVTYPELSTVNELDNMVILASARGTATDRVIELFEVTHRPGFEYPARLQIIPNGDCFNVAHTSIELEGMLFEAVNRSVIKTAIVNLLIRKD